MEVCEMVPGQRSVKLTEDQTAIMIKNTAKRPDKRKQAIDRIVRFIFLLIIYSTVYK